MKTDGIDSYLKMVRHPVKFRMFLLTRLPSAFFCGVRVRSIDKDHCTASVPYKWLSRNPFRSTYFACLSMAAEMSTGALAMMYVYQRSPGVSMLVVSVESKYFKKATGRTTFSCHDGEEFRKEIEECISTGEGRIVKARSIGTNDREEVIAEFLVTWSFKVRKS